MCSCPIRLQDSVHQYLWKETLNVLDFLYRDVYHGKIASKCATVGWVWPGVLSHSRLALVCQALTLVDLVAV